MIEDVDNIEQPAPGKRGIEKAVEAAGGVLPLATALGVSHQAVYKFLRQGWVPPIRAVEIELLYGVPRRELVSPRLLDLVDVSRADDIVQQ